MKSQTEELLYYLLWSADTLMRPTWRRLEEPFEAWAWRNGLIRRLGELERQKLIERHPEPNLDRVVRLTQAGRRHALGGRDPIDRWSRPWDGRWRLVMFDLPAARAHLRKQLWRTLRRHDFGYLQYSVWASPDGSNEIRAVLGTSKVQADNFLLFEGRPGAGETDGEIVDASWDFARINAGYERYLALASREPPHDARIAAWSRRENSAWREAIKPDPLLPRALHPPGYLGPDALQRRKSLFASLAGVSGKF